jgi:hypothetical protein
MTGTTVQVKEGVRGEKGEGRVYKEGGNRRKDRVVQGSTHDVTQW